MHIEVWSGTSRAKGLFWLQLLQALLRSGGMERQQAPDDSQERLRVLQLQALLATLQVWLLLMLFLHSIVCQSDRALVIWPKLSVQGTNIVRTHCDRFAVCQKFAPDYLHEAL